MGDREAGWTALERLSVPQRGFIHVRQADQAGLARETLRRVSRIRSWNHPYRGVIQMPSAGKSAEGRIVAALLAVQEPVLPWGWTAAWLWGLVSALPTKVNVLIPHSRRAPRHDRVVATRMRRFELVDAVKVRDILTPTPAATLCGMAGLVALPVLRGFMIDARQRRLTDLARISACCSALSPMKGGGAVRRVLRELDADQCDSELEWQLRRKLRALGFRPDSRPAEVDTGFRTLHIDIPWSRQRVGIEVDGFGSHSSRASLDTDILRHNRMQRTDWRILHAGWAQLDAKFSQLVDDVTWLLSQPPTR